MSLNVGVTGQDRMGTTFTIGAKASNLNCHGGTIAIGKELTIGSTIGLRNARNNEAEARIVRLVNEYAGMRTYGIEFLSDASGFWGIVFPKAEQMPRLRGARNEF